MQLGRADNVTVWAHSIYEPLIVPIAHSSIVTTILTDFCTSLVCINSTSTSNPYPSNVLVASITPGVLLINESIALQYALTTDVWQPAVDFKRTCIAAVA
jgi:hypothetical protein